MWSEKGGMKGDRETGRENQRERAPSCCSDSHRDGVNADEAIGDGGRKGDRQAGLGEGFWAGGLHSSLFSGTWTGPWTGHG